MTFRELRQRAGLSQVEAGRLLNVAQQTICHWEIGKSSPWQKYYRDIQRVYGCTMLELAMALEESKQQ